MSLVTATKTVLMIGLVELAVPVLGHACYEPDRELVPFAFSSSPPFLAIKHRVDYNPPQVRIRIVDLSKSTVSSEIVIAGGDEDETTYATRSQEEAVAITSKRSAERLRAAESDLTGRGFLIGSGWRGIQKSSASKQKSEKYDLGFGGLVVDLRKRKSASDIAVKSGKKSIVLVKNASESSAPMDAGGIRGVYVLGANEWLLVTWEYQCRLYFVTAAIADLTAKLSGNQ